MRENLKKSLKIGAMAAILLLLIGGAAAGLNKNQDHIKKVDYNKSKLGLGEVLHDFETVLVEPQGFKEAADGGYVKLRLSGREFELELAPAPIQAEDAVLIIETENGTQTLSAPAVYTYKGKVKAIPESKALFTAADNVLLGIIYVDDEFFSIEQTSHALNGQVIHVVYSSKMLREKINATPLPLDGDVIEPSEKASEGKTQAGSIGILTTTTVNLLAAYDTEFSNKFSNPTAEIANMLNNIVSTAYSAPEVLFSISSYRYYTNIPNGDCGSVLSNFRSTSSSDRDATSSDLAFLFSGKNFYGTAGGCAYRYAGASYGFATAQMVAEPGTYYGATFQERSIVAAHETGHNFDAGHETDTNPAYARAYTWKYLGIWDRYTAVWSQFMGVGTLGGMQLEFSNSNNHGDSTHDNVRRIRETKTTVAGYR